LGKPSDDILKTKYNNKEIYFLLLIRMVYKFPQQCLKKSY